MSVRSINDPSGINAELVERLVGKTAYDIVKLVASYLPEIELLAPTVEDIVSISEVLDELILLAPELDMLKEVSNNLPDILAVIANEENINKAAQATDILAEASDLAGQMTIDAANTADNAALVTNFRNETLNFRNQTESFYNQTVIAAMAQNVYPVAARDDVPCGATGTVTITGGIGGADGTFDLAFTGGNFAVNPTGTFTVSGGVVTAISLTGPGLYIGDNPIAPTLIFSASSDLTGAVATLTVGLLVPAGGFYFTPSEDDGYVAQFQNVAGVATLIEEHFDPLSVGAAKDAAESAASLFETLASVNLYDPATMRIAGKYVSNDGTIKDDAAWAYIMVPVAPGQAYAWASNSTRPNATAFLDVDGVGLSPSTYDGSASGAGVSQTRTAPAGAAFVAINIKSNTIAEPTQMMVNVGTAALPYEPYFTPYNVVTEQAASRAVAEAGEVFNQPWHNVLEDGDFVLGDPSIRSASGIVDLTHPDMLERGLARGIQWRAGNEYIRYEHGASLLDKYFFACFVVNSVDAANLPTGPTMLREASTEGAVSGQFATLGHVVISPTTRLLWAHGQVAGGDPNLLIGSAIAPPVAGTRFASEFTMLISDTPFDLDAMIRQVNLAAKARGQARKWALSVEGDAPTPPLPARGKLVLTGNGGTGYVESDRSGHLIRNNFDPFPIVAISSVPCKFNIVSQALDGAVVRSGGTDDIAPDHVDAKTLDANHGYTLGRCTAVGHGLDASREGEIATKDGVEHVLVKVESANSLLIATRNSNTTPTTGSFALSGGGNITVTAVSSIQWYPPHNNYSLRLWVDGGEITDRTGEWTYVNDVQFVETCDLLARQTIIDWWIANGGASGGVFPEGLPLYRSVVTYRFDRDGQLTIHRSWTFLAPTAVTDLMGVQVARVSNPLTYRVPNAVPFAYDGDTLDYGMGVASDRTLTASGTPNINFTPTRLGATGEYAHRLISEWSASAFAAGILPVGDAAYDVRRTNTSNNALQIRGNTAKVYFRVIDKGGFTAQAGDSFEMVGFRHILPRQAGRPLVCPVRYSDSRAIVYIDWTDFAGFDQVSISPDLIGRTVTVLDSRNAALVGGALATGSVTANVSASGDHGYLVLELAA